MPTGLSSSQATQLLKQYGPNIIDTKKKESIIIRFLSYFKNPLTIILLVSAFLSGSTGEYKNAIIILLVVLLSTILDFYQEFKSGKAIDTIMKRLESTVTVIRDGKDTIIPTSQIVP